MLPSAIVHRSNYLWSIHLAWRNIRCSFSMTCLKNASISQKKKISTGPFGEVQMWGNNKEKLLPLLQTFILLAMVKQMCQLRYIRAIHSHRYCWIRVAPLQRCCLCILCHVQLCGLGPVWPVWLYGIELFSTYKMIRSCWSEKIYTTGTGTITLWTFYVCYMLLHLYYVTFCNCT